MSNTDLIRHLRAEHAKHFDALGDLLFDAARALEAAEADRRVLETGRTGSMSADRTIPTTAEVRERFIDGFPMDTWVAARAECGEDFDRWLAEHDAQVLRDAAERLNEEGQNLPRWPGRTRDMPRISAFVDGVLDSRLFLHGVADQRAPKPADLEPVKFDPPLTEAEADAYWDAISDEPESSDLDAGPSGSGHSPSVETVNAREDSGGSVEEPSTHLIHGPASTHKPGDPS